MLSPMRLANDYDIDISNGLIYAKGTKQRKFNKLSSKGYLCEVVNSVTYYAHHILYFWVTGKQPRHIKHIDNNKLNNKFENLYTVQSIKATKYSNKKLFIDNLISYYEKEIPNIISEIIPRPYKKVNPTPNKDSSLPTIINEDYTTNRTNRGNWILYYKGKFDCYKPAYSEILKYISMKSNTIKKEYPLGELIQEKNRKQ